MSHDFAIKFPVLHKVKPKTLSVRLDPKTYIQLQQISDITGASLSSSAAGLLSAVVPQVLENLLHNDSE